MQQLSQRYYRNMFLTALFTAFAVSEAASNAAQDAIATRAQTEHCLTAHGTGQKGRRMAAECIDCTHWEGDTCKSGNTIHGENPLQWKLLMTEFMPSNYEDMGSKSFDQCASLAQEGGYKYFFTAASISPNDNLGYDWYCDETYTNGCYVTNEDYTGTDPSYDVWNYFAVGPAESVEPEPEPEPEPECPPECLKRAREAKAVRGLLFGSMPELNCPDYC